MSNLESIQAKIDTFRATLEDGGLTAKAIDRNDSYEEIAISARDEGHDDFAAIMEQAAADWVA